LNSKKCALLVTALALPFSIGAASAGGEFDKLEKIACADLKYSSEFLEKYPTAPAACLEGRIAEGKRYGKFTAKVYLNSPEVTTVQLLNVKGDPLTTFSFKPGPDAHITIDGEKTAFKDLKTGEKINFWISEDRMTASELPGSTEESWAVLPPVKK
jgi:hypothetical protein